MRRAIGLDRKRKRSPSLLHPAPHDRVYKNNAHLVAKRSPGVRARARRRRAWWTRPIEREKVEMKKKYHTRTAASIGGGWGGEWPYDYARPRYIGGKTPLTNVDGRMREKRGGRRRGVIIRLRVRFYVYGTLWWDGGGSLRLEDASHR